MKIRNVLAFLPVCVGLIAVAAQPGHAWPIGPSAVEAARLKVNPPNNWIAWYLPDDRYKVAGGVWKVVTTELDTYYHRPNCPNMLRQDNTRVLGFESAKDAEDSGYRPDRTCAPDTNFSSGGGSRAAGPAAGGVVRLADGVSSITIPKGWTVSGAQAIKSGTQTIGVNLFMSPNNEKLTLTTMEVPTEYATYWRQAMDPERVNKAREVWRGFRGSSSVHVVTRDAMSDKVMGVLDDVMFRSKASKWSIGGLQGIKYAPQGVARFTDGSTAAYGVIKGNKVFLITDYTASKSGASKIVGSLKPR